MTLDPYRTLGVDPGASVAEIKRAYRRLAKEHHPDSGGPAELPRFLAIQAAYEMLTAGHGLGPAIGPGAGQGGPGRGTSGSGGGGPAWRADPARARATRDAWRRGGRGRSTSGEPGGTAGTAGTDGPDGAGATGTRRGRGAAGDPGGPSGPGGPGGGGPREGARHGRGGRRTATPGSTTYDEVHHDQHEPGWTGGSWYGQASGTYWTINPREYADPRKHGPEYLARARKATQVGDPGPGPADASRAADGTRPTDAPGRAGERPHRTRPGAAESSAGPTPAPGAGGPPGGRHTTWTPGDRRPFGDSQGGAQPGPPLASDHGRPRAGHHLPGERGFATQRASNPGEPPSPGVTPDTGRAADAGSGSFSVSGVVGTILVAPVRAPGRLVLALAGWPPLGVAIALLLGEVSGCARFAATCASTSSFTTGVLAAQLVILAALFVAVPLARLAAVGSLAAVLAALPAMAFLTAVGAPYSPQGGPASLLVLLGIAWLVGVVVGLRVRLTGSRSARHRAGRST